MITLSLNWLVPVIKKIIRDVFHNKFRSFLEVVLMMMSMIFFNSKVTVNLPFFDDTGTNSLVECSYIVNV